MKKFLNFIMTFVVVCSMMPTFASAETITYLSEPNPDYIFSVYGEAETYTLLGGDSNSGFFVIANDFYGTRPYASVSGTGYSFTDTNSIGYWLNNGFKTEENTLPQNIMSYIDTEHIWEEGVAGISLLSKNELDANADKIGFNAAYNKTEEGSDNRWWMRDNAGNVSRPYVCWVSSGEPTVSTYTGTNSRLVRPVFYLKADFFKNIRLNVCKMGKEVKKKILELDMSAAHYTNAEKEIIADTDSNFVVAMKGEILPDDTLPTEPYFDITVDVTANEKENFYILVTSDYTETIRKDVSFTDGSVQRVRVYLDTANKKVKYTASLYYKDLLTASISDSVAALDNIENDGYINKGYGTHITYSGYSVEETITLLKRAGATVVRDHDTWAGVEKEKGKYVFNENIIKYVDELYKNGIEMMYILCDNNPLYGDAWNGVIDTQEEIDGFVNYALATAKQFPQIKRYEVLNERDTTYTPEQYAALCKAVGKALKEHDPEIKISVGALSTLSGWKDFAKAMVTEEAYPYVDAVSTHLYHIYYKGDSNMFVADSNDVQGYIRDFGGWLDLELTETGYSTNGPWLGSTDLAVTPELQAVEMIKRSVMSDCVGMSFVTNYVLKEDVNSGESYQFVENDGTPMPAYYAVREFYDRTKYAEFMGEIYIQDNVYAFWYRDSGKNMVVLWQKTKDTFAKHTDDSAVDVTFADGITAYDIYGDEVNQNGTLSLQTYPMWVEGLSEEYLRNAYRLSANGRLSSAAEYIGGSVSEFVTEYEELCANPTFDGVTTLLNEIYEYGKTMIKNNTETDKVLSAKLSELSDMADEIAKLMVLCDCSSVSAESVRKKLSSNSSVYKSFEEMTGEMESSQMIYKDRPYRYGKQLIEKVSKFKDRKRFAEAKTEHAYLAEDGKLVIEGTGEQVRQIAIKLENDNAEIVYIGFCESDENGFYSLQTYLTVPGEYTLTVEDGSRHIENISSVYDGELTDEEKRTYTANIAAEKLLEWSQLMLDEELKTAECLCLENIDFSSDESGFDFRFVFDNTFGYGQSEVMYIAAYSDGILTSCSTETLHEGENSISLRLDCGGINREVKVMLWKNNNIEPLKKAFVIN